MKALKCLFVGFMVLGLVSMLTVAQAETIWNVPDPDNGINTIQDAISLADPDGGDTIIVAAGVHAGANVDRPVIIVGEDGAHIKSSADPTLVAGFQIRASGSGSTISNFTIDCSPSFYYAVIGLSSSNITLSHLKIINLIDVGVGIYVFNSSNSTIIHNEISGNGRLQTGIQIGSSPRGVGPYQGSLIAFNKIDFETPDNPDFRENFGISLVPFKSLQNNKVIHNYVSGIVGISLSDVNSGTLLNNYIGFNDVRDCEYGIVECQEGVLSENIISRNLGNSGYYTTENPEIYEDFTNRAFDGIDPSEFAPGQ